MTDVVGPSYVRELGSRTTKYPSPRGPRRRRWRGGPVLACTARVRASGCRRRTLVEIRSRRLLVVRKVLSPPPKEPSELLTKPHPILVTQLGTLAVQQLVLHLHRERRDRREDDDLLVREESVQRIQEKAIDSGDMSIGIQSQEALDVVLLARSSIRCSGVRFPGTLWTRATRSRFRFCSLNSQSCDTTTAKRCSPCKITLVMGRSATGRVNDGVSVMTVTWLVSCGKNTSARMSPWRRPGLQPWAYTSYR